MTFTLNTKTLAMALKPMAKVIKGKIAFPVLAGIHVRTGEGTARFTVTDLETSISATLEHNTDGLPVEAVIADGKGFIKAISGKGDTTIAIEETRVLVACNGAHLVFPTLSADYYPVIPSLSPDTLLLGITADNLSRMIGQTSYAISKDESRFTLNGALLEVDLPRLRMVATDGHRLAISDSIADPVSSAMFPHRKILIPRFALSLMDAWSGNSTVYIGRNLVDETDAKTGLVQHDVPGPFLHFVFGNTTIVTRHLTGNFPDYQRVLPEQKPNRYTLQVERKPLLSALQTAAKYADEQSKAVVLRLNGCAKVYTKLNDSPSFTADVPATWNGPEDGEAMYNASYLIDWLKAQTTPVVTMAFAPPVPSGEMDDDGNPIMREVWNNSAMDCYGDHNTRALVMSMRL